jgi:hypothetical protein
MSTTTKKVCGAAVTKQTGGKRNTSYGKKTKVGGNYGSNMMKESESCKSGEVKNQQGKCVSVASLKGKKIVIAQNYKKLKDALPNLNKNLSELNKKYDYKMQNLSTLVKKVLELSHNENEDLKNQNEELKIKLNEKDRKEIETQNAGKRLTKQRGGLIPLRNSNETKEKIHRNTQLCKTNNDIITESLIALLYEIHDEHIGSTIETEKKNYERFRIDKRIEYINTLKNKKYKENKYIDSINEIRKYHTLVSADDSTIKKKKKILEDYFDFDAENDDGKKPGVTIPNLMRKMYLTNDDINFRVQAAMQDVSDITGNRTTFGVLADKSDTGTRMIGKMLNKITPGSRKYKTIEIDTEKA